MDRSKAEDDIFAKAELAQTRTVYSTAATSITGLPIQPDVVERMLKERLSKVQTWAIRDLLRGCSSDLLASKPTTDFINTLASFVVELSDVNSKSQTVTSALLRDGVAFATGVALSNAARKNPALVGTCKLKDDKAPETDRIALYASVTHEALAASHYFRVLGFPFLHGNRVHRLPGSCTATLHVRRCRRSHRAECLHGAAGE